MAFLAFLRSLFGGSEPAKEDANDSNKNRKVDDKSYADKFLLDSETSSSSATMFVFSETSSTDDKETLFGVFDDSESSESSEATGVFGWWSKQATNNKNDNADKSSTDSTSINKKESIENNKSGQSLVSDRYDTAKSNGKSDRNAQSMRTNRPKSHDDNNSTDSENNSNNKAATNRRDKKNRRVSAATAVQMVQSFKNIALYGSNYTNQKDNKHKKESKNCEYSTLNVTPRKGIKAKNSDVIINNTRLSFKKDAINKRKNIRNDTDSSDSEISSTSSRDDSIKRMKIIKTYEVIDYKKDTGNKDKKLINHVEIFDKRSENSKNMCDSTTEAMTPTADSESSVKNMEISNENMHITLPMDPKSLLSSVIETISKNGNEIKYTVLEDSIKDAQDSSQTSNSKKIMKFDGKSNKNIINNEVKLVTKCTGYDTKLINSANKHKTINNCDDASKPKPSNDPETESVTKYNRITKIKNNKNEEEANVSKIIQRFRELLDQYSDTLMKKPKRNMEKVDDDTKQVIIENISENIEDVECNQVTEKNSTFTSTQNYIEYSQRDPKSSQFDGGTKENANFKEQNDKKYHNFDGKSEINSGKELVFVHEFVQGIDSSNIKQNNEIENQSIHTKCKKGLKDCISDKNSDDKDSMKSIVSQDSGNYKLTRKKGDPNTNINLLHADVDANEEIRNGNEHTSVKYDNARKSYSVAKICNQLDIGSSKSSTINIENDNEKFVAIVKKIQDHHDFTISFHENDSKIKKARKSSVSNSNESYTTTDMKKDEMIDNSNENTITNNLNYNTNLDAEKKR